MGCLKSWSWICGAAVLLLVPPGWSAPAEEPPPVRELSCCVLFAQTLPEVYFRDAEGLPQRLVVERERFSIWNRIPLVNPLPLYRKTVDAEGNEVFEPQGEIALPPGTAPVRLLYYLDHEGKMNSTVITDARDRHGALQIRALNFTRQPVVLSINDTAQPIGMMGEHIFPPQKDKDVRFSFQYGARTHDRRDYVSPALNLRFRRDNHRLTVIFGYRPEIGPKPDGGSGVIGFKLDAMRFYDFLPETDPQ